MLKIPTLYRLSMLLVVGWLAVPAAGQDLGAPTEPAALPLLTPEPVAIGPVPVNFGPTKATIPGQASPQIRQLPEPRRLPSPFSVPGSHPEHAGDQSGDPAGTRTRIVPALPAAPPSAYEPLESESLGYDPLAEGLLPSRGSDAPAATRAELAWPSPHSILDSTDGTTAEGQFTDALEMSGGRRMLADYWSPWHAFARRMHRPGLLRRIREVAWQESGRAHSITCDLGIGHERVMYAPSVLETPISTANIGVYLQSDRGLNAPDRAAYYWGRGPGYDAGVDTLDTRLRMELGNEKLLAITEFTMRSLDPTTANNTTGFGDMTIGAKALMLDGKRLKLSSIFRTYLATGVERRGLGTGHTSLEPGLLASYCLSRRTYLFGEMKYWIPLGADPSHAGDVLTTGVAFSTILRESDVYAVLPTFELRTLSFLFGTEGVAGGGSRRIDGRTAVELYPGARIVLGPSGDLGLWEFNVAAGFTVADADWFDSRLIWGLRWNY